MPASSIRVIILKLPLQLGFEGGHVRFFDQYKGNYSPFSNVASLVIPAKAGIQYFLRLDLRLRGGDIGKS